MTQSFEDQMFHFMLENKRILNLHEKKFADFGISKQTCISNKYQCHNEKLGDSSRAAGLILAKLIHKCIPKAETNLSGTS